MNMRYSPFFFFTGKTVGIEPATSLSIISRPADDTIVKKWTKNVAQQIYAVPRVFAFS